jgi:DNA-binding Lrp family transcriptional regulator
MTANLLTLLSDGKTHSQHELAGYFHTTPESIMARIDFLQQAGYIKRVCMPQNCGMKCAGCHIKAQTPKNYPAFWELVKKREE